MIRKLEILFRILFFSFFILVSFPLEIQADNSSGRLFQWTPSSSIISEIPNLNGFISISTGHNHSLAIRADSTVWAWGKNTDGQLGNGTLVESLVPVQVKGSGGNDWLTDIKMVSAGDRYSMALKNNGTIWVWGENGFGIRGTGIDIANNFAPPILYPTQVKALDTNFKDIIKIGAGDNHSIALKNDGSVFTWGSNGADQLGLGCSSAPGSSCSNKFYPTHVPSLINVIDIASGRIHNLIVKSDFTVWGWGRALEGQLGNAASGAATINNPKQIPGLNNIKKVSAKYSSSAALSNNGTVFEWGNRSIVNPAGQDPRLVQNLDDVVEIGAGLFTSFSVKSDGTVWKWDRDNIIAQQVPLSNISKVEGSIATPNLAVEKYNPTPSGPTPFLDLPWNYEDAGLSFSEAALSINSFFDHEYPLLSTNQVDEPQESINSVLTFFGFPRNASISYSSHDGYDWGRAAKVHLGDDVLAAAEGEAEYKNECASCGHMIVINHNNGYQTKYMHLLPTGLVINQPNLKVNVAQRQKIGEVGNTGNSYGAHIHFGVFEDKNKDGNFSDNFTDGATDPFGWQSEDTDPWSIFKFIQGGIERKGNKSTYLWEKLIDKVKKTLDAAGGEIELDNFKFIFPENSTNSTLNINIMQAPIINPSATLSSLGTSIVVEAFNNLGEKITQFVNPFILSIDYSHIDLTKYVAESISIYSSNDGVNWQKEPTNVDHINKMATAQINHLTHFALLAERKDTIAPTTTIITVGEKGQIGWFRSDVNITLNAEDNEDGLGVDFTSYSKDESEWEIYKNAFSYMDEGSYNIQYYSVDKDENIEEAKTFDFYIDKTPPTVTVATDKSFIWPPNGKLIPITIMGSATDDNISQSWVTIQDEYGEISPILASFGETVYLRASRRGDDLNGRKYIITAKALDMAENLTSKTSEVIVLHNQN